MWIWSLSVFGLSGLAALATVAGLVGAGLIAAAVALGGFGLSAQWLRASDLGGITAAVVGGIGGIVLVPAELAALAVAVSRETEPRMCKVCATAAKAHECWQRVRAAGNEPAMRAQVFSRGREPADAILKHKV